MRLFLVLLSTGLLIFYSCGSSNSSNSVQDPVSQAHSDMHNQVYDEAMQENMESSAHLLVGKYKATIPCNTCKAIDLELILLDEMRFKYTKTYKGEPEEVVTTEGSFAINPDWSIELKEANGNIMKYKKTGENLVSLDKSKNLFVSGIPQGTTLYKEKP